MSNTIRNVDFLAPVRVVSEANQREHWAAKMRRKNEQQELMAVAMQNALRGRRVELPCSVMLTRIGPKALDSDNLAGSFKHCQDAIARKLGADDGDTEKLTFTYSQAPVRVREYGVKVTITSQS